MYHYDTTWFKRLLPICTSSAVRRFHLPVSGALPEGRRRGQAGRFWYVDETYIKVNRGLNQWQLACEYVGQAFKTARTIAVKPIMLEALASATDLLIDCGAYEEAQLAISAVEAHPAARQMTRTRIAQTKAVLPVNQSRNIGDPQPTQGRLPDTDIESLFERFAPIFGLRQT